MPLLLKNNVMPGVLLGLWKIDESYEDFFILYPWLDCLRNSIESSHKSVQRRCEILAVRLLIREIIDEEVTLFHEKDGRPYLSNGLNISISHTKGYAVIIVSKSKIVSVDIEYISQRVLKIKDKFMRTDEHACSLIEYLIHWCTKETLYKIFVGDNLTFTKMQLLSINGDNSNGIITAKNIFRDQEVNVYYFIINDAVITYAAI